MLRLASALRRLEADGSRALESVTTVQQQLETLIEVLVLAGSLKPGHVAMLKRIARDVTVARTPQLELGDVADKYAVEVDAEPIDCDARLHLCQARCCSFAVKLSRQDLEEGEVAWDIDHPYRLPRKADGYCTYLARTGDDAGRCTNYLPRPATCRSYSCRDDARVWLDFEARIPAPIPDTLVPIRLGKRTP